MCLSVILTGLINAYFDDDDDKKKSCRIHNCILNQILANTSYHSSHNNSEVNIIQC